MKALRASQREGKPFSQQCFKHPGSTNVGEEESKAWASRGGVGWGSLCSLHLGFQLEVIQSLLFPIGLWYSLPNKSWVNFTTQVQFKPKKGFTITVGFMKVNTWGAWGTVQPRSRRSFCQANSVLLGYVFEVFKVLLYKLSQDELKTINSSSPSNWFIERPRVGSCREYPVSWYFTHLAATLSLLDS